MDRLHPAFLDFLEMHGIPDQSDYPSAKWVERIYELLVAELFPQYKPEKTDLPPWLARFAYFRALFAQINVQISLDDLRYPVRDELKSRLNAFGSYLEYRADIMASQEIEEILLKLDKCQAVADRIAKVQAEISPKEAQLDEEKNLIAQRSAVHNDKQNHAEKLVTQCKELDHQYLEMEEAQTERAKKLERLNQEVEYLEKEIADHQQFIVNGELRNTIKELEQARAKQQARNREDEKLRAQIAKYKSAIEELESLQAGLAPAHPMYSALVELRKELEGLKTKRNKLKHSLTAKRAVIATLKEELQQALDKAANITKMEQGYTRQIQERRQRNDKENVLLESTISALKSELENLNRELNENDRDYEQKRKHRLEMQEIMAQAPKRLKALEDELDAVLGELPSLEVKL